MSETSETSEATVTGFAPGTVVRYESRAGEDRQRDRGWCREGMAVADKYGRLLDTYWASMSDAHVLTDAERETAEVLFNTNDYDELDYGRGGRAKWEMYADAEREFISSQHHLQFRWFVRKGSEPDLETQIGNAERRLQEAHEGLRSAAVSVERCARDLAKLEAKR